MFKPVDHGILSPDDCKGYAYINDIDYKGVNAVILMYQELGGCYEPLDDGILGIGSGVLYGLNKMIVYNEYYVNDYTSKHQLTIMNGLKDSGKKKIEKIFNKYMDYLEECEC